MLEKKDSSQYWQRYFNVSVIESDEIDIYVKIVVRQMIGQLMNVANATLKTSIIATVIFIWIGG